MLLLLALWLLLLTVRMEPASDGRCWMCSSQVECVGSGRDYAIAAIGSSSVTDEGGGGKGGIVSCMVVIPVRFRRSIRVFHSAA